MPSTFPGKVFSGISGFSGTSGTRGVSGYAAGITVYTATISLNFGLIVTGTTYGLTGTVTGAAVGDYCILIPPADVHITVPQNAFSWFTRVTSANTVTVYVSNGTGVDRTVGTGFAADYKVMVLHV